MSRPKCEGVEEEKCGSTEPPVDASPSKSVKLPPMCWLQVVSHLPLRDASVFLNGVSKAVKTGLPKTAERLTQQRLYPDLWNKPLDEGLSFRTIHEDVYQVKSGDPAELKRRKQLLSYVRLGERVKFFHAEPPLKQAELICIADLLPTPKTQKKRLIDLIIELQPQWLEDIYRQLILPSYSSPVCDDLTFYDRRGPLNLRLIHWAAILNQVGDLRVLMAKKPNSINDSDNQFGSPLWLAAKYGHYDAVVALLAHAEIDVNLTVKNANPCYIAVMHGHTRVVDRLLHCVDFKESYCGANRISMLVAAVLNADVGMINLLLSSGKVDVNYKMVDGQSALSVAEKKKDVLIISALRSHMEPVSKPCVLQ